MTLTISTDSRTMRLTMEGWTMRKLSRWISMLMVLAMLMTCVPITALSDEAEQPEATGKLTENVGSVPNVILSVDGVALAARPRRCTCPPTSPW